MDHSASLYRRGSDYEDNDGKGELKKVAFLGSYWSEHDQCGFGAGQTGTRIGGLPGR